MTKWLLVPLSSLFFLFPQIANAAGCSIASSTLSSSANLKAYWKMDGNANDSIGTANGTATNVSWSTGVFATSGVFVSANSSRILTTYKPTFATSTFVLNFKTSDTTYQEMFGFWQLAGGAFIDTHVGNSGSGSVSFRWQDASGNYQDATTVATTFSDNAWHRAVFTRSGQTIKIYIDGVNQSLTTGSSGTIPDLTPGTGVDIGVRYDTNPNGRLFMNGSLDDIAYFDTELTAQQIADLESTTSTLCGYTPPSGGGTTSTPVLIPQGYTLADFTNRYYNEISEILASFLAIGLFVGIYKGIKLIGSETTKRYGNINRNR